MDRTDSRDNDLKQRLSLALTGALAPAQMALGSRLLHQLDRPVQIAIVGPAGAGKGLLRDLLARQPALQGCVLADPVPVQNAPVVRAAVDQANVVLWCAPGFGPADHALWDAQPDRIRDHSFLVLTKADVLAARGQLSGVLAALRDSSADACLGVFPIASPQAMTATGLQDAAGLRSSGVAALTTAISRQIALDRGALHDRVLVFLGRCCTAPTTKTAPVVASPPRWFRPLAYLTAQAAMLTPAPGLDAAARVSLILDHCCAVADGLADHLPAGDTPAEHALTDDVLCVADMMILLRLEGGGQSAVDALTVLAQLRREFAALG